ncbi:MAG: hypothetical protein ACLT9P_09660 [Evtepia gabavorous]
MSRGGAVTAGCVVYQEVEVVHDYFPHHHGGPGDGSPDPRYMGTRPVGGRETGCGLRAYLQRERSPWMPPSDSAVTPLRVCSDQHNLVGGRG